MRQLERDLWQSTLHQSGILSTHAYFLERREGNVLLYNIGDDRDLETIDELGGVRYQLLSHRDESGPSLERTRSRFGSKLYCSAREAPFVGQDAPVDVIFDEGDSSLEDIDVIYTPGHTDGSICFFYRSPTGKSYLFTGDTVFQWNGRWATLVLRNAGGSNEALAESLLRLRDFEPDVVLWSGFVGEVSFAEVTREEWKKAVDGVVGRLNKGRSDYVPSSSCSIDRVDCAVGSVQRAPNRSEWAARRHVSGPNPVPVPVWSLEPELCT